MQLPVRRPTLPRPLALPLRLVPQAIQAAAAAQVLNRVFQQQRTEGELDFLEKRCVRIAVDDTGAAFNLTLTGEDLRAAGPMVPDLHISGTLYDFLLLITGREDPDTLFFQRRLKMQGDTELGVYLKNFLASVDPATLPLANLVQPALTRGLNLYERLA